MIKSQTPPIEPGCDFEIAITDYDGSRFYPKCGRRPAIPVHTNEDTMHACFEHINELRACLAADLMP